VKSSGVFCLFLIPVLLIIGCTQAVRVGETPVEKKKPEPVVEEKGTPPTPELLPDYSSIELEVLSIHRLEESYRPYNSSNPRFSSREQWIAFEANNEMLKKIYIYDINRDTLALENEGEFKKTGEVYLEEGFGEEAF
jgi:hypothetical protein